ncbi:MAG: M48 family metallopeptidase [Leptolyngbya sp. Prado105]|jgi:predicted Zn-dependent protease|nr:M48 family metallopeptidase [Leptolyngbya sp. Prado105]
MITKTLRRRWFYPILSIVMAAGICLGQPMLAQAISWTDLLRGGIQIIQANQLSRLSDSQEEDFGRQINAQVTREVKILNDPRLTAYVNEIGQKLATNSDRPNIRYTFQVVDQKSINAFATMGGFVYVHRGLLDAADNEAQVASVIGHEIGHIAGKHALRQMRQTAVQRGLLAAGGLDRSTIANLGVQVALRLPNSRRDEYDADERGVRALGRAGYAQSEAVAFMRKLLNSASPPTFLANHPATSDRITNMQRIIRQNPSSGTAGLDSSSYRARLR